MVYSMSALINDTIKLQNVLMILMEICLILEFIVTVQRLAGHEKTDGVD